MMGFTGKQVLGVALISIGTGIVLNVVTRLILGAVAPSPAPSTAGKS